MLVLGISAFYHDAAAAIVRDGEIVAAAQEERFSRRKHDPRFPRAAINYCLEEALVEPDELDAVAFYDHPLLSLDRTIKCLVAATPRAEEQWLRVAPTALGVKPLAGEWIRRELKCEVQVVFVEHHMSHAASAFYPSPFHRAAILTVDGVGEWATTAIGRGEGGSLELLTALHYPHSLGLLYSAFTYFCGFAVNDGEYKLMGLAPFGQPIYVDRIRDRLIDLRADGSFRLNEEYFGFLDSGTMTNDKFAACFGGPPREPKSRITRREMDMAASIQQVLTEAVLALARRARSLTGERDLVLAGGVALNCVANGRLLQEQIFDHLWIQPASGDAGGALGAALLTVHRRCGVKRPQRRNDGQRGSFLGPAFSAAEVHAFLDREKLPYRVVADIDARAAVVASALAAGDVVGHFSGRMEYGPRALGGRSILADPRRCDMQANLNLRIKFRESFRPFAPAVLAERCADYFELEAESPYMLLVASVALGRRLVVDGLGDDGDLVAAVNQARSDIPAVTHLDYSARIQTVGIGDNPSFYAVLKAFEASTGCAVLINTSFNVRDEPIVCTPRDAYRCFMATGMDMLVLEDCILLKVEQPPQSSTKDSGECIPSFDGCPEERLRRFYEDYLVPAGAAVVERGERFWDEPDNRATYYEEYKEWDETGSAMTVEEIFAALGRLWEDQDLPELAGLVAPLAELAAELAARGEEQDAPSPFIYAMF